MLNPHLPSLVEDWRVMSTDTSKDTINLLKVTASPTSPIITTNSCFSQQSLSLDKCINGSEYDGLLSQHHRHHQQHLNSNHMLLSSNISQVLSLDQCSANNITDDGLVSHRHLQEEEEQHEEEGPSNALLTTSSTWCQSYGIEAPVTGPIQTNGDMCRENSQGENSMQSGQGFLDMALLGTHTTIAHPQGAKDVRSGVRARRGQATDPHSIAERHRRERIAERMKALQELIPNANKSDKAPMLDEIIDYVKFLQLQVKVLSMSRLGGAAPMVDEDGIMIAERQVVKLMEDDMGLAMQFLHAKGLFLVPLSLTTCIPGEK